MKSRDRARSLRQNPTEAERRLWSRLRNRQVAGCKFRRQHPTAGFFVDFACLERGLVVEVDGGQHLDDARADALRTERIESAGFRVLRFWNNQVLGELDSVIGEIERALSTPTPSLPRFAGEGDGPP
jgi:very-short-patch-repair endonuclease